MSLLAGRHALITGASQGLGFAIAQAFVREGADVFLCARDGIALEHAQSRLAGEAGRGRKVLAAQCDVSQEADVDRVVRAALAAFPDLQVLVNNAGIYGPLGSIETVNWTEWMNAVQINLFGSVLASRALVPHFKRRGGGKIIQISGGGATNPLPNMSAYAASKAGIVRFAETLAEELRAFHVDVNAVAPGMLNTRLLDQVLDAGPERAGASFYERARKQKAEGGVPLERGADLCVYLASTASDGITGKLISALWDPWETLQEKRADLDGSDIYALRRIVPKDRGKGWGDR